MEENNTTPDESLVIPEMNNIDIGKCFSDSWILYKKHALLYSSLSILFVIASIVSSRAGNFANFFVNLLYGPLMASITIAAAKSHKDEPITFATFFSYPKPILLTLIGASLLTGLLSLIGLVFLIIPGLYLIIGYSFTIPAIIDRDLNIWQAMEFSRKSIDQKWFKLFLFVICTWLLNLVGILALGIGLIVSFPVSIIAIYFAYKQCIGFDNI